MMNDFLDYDEQVALERERQLLATAFMPLDAEAMRGMERWFRESFNIHQAAFRVVDGDWNALDAMRQDAFRLVWLTFEAAWKSIHEPEINDVP